MQSKSQETNDSSVFAGKAVRRDAESYREDNPSEVVIIMTIQVVTIQFEDKA